MLAVLGAFAAYASMPFAFRRLCLSKAEYYLRR
jgi:hypothetical protein